WAATLKDYFSLDEGKFLPYDVLDDAGPNESLAHVLTRHGAAMFYVDAAAVCQFESAHPGIIRGLTEHGAADGWRVAAHEEPAGDTGEWWLFRHARPGEIVPSVLQGMSLFTGWRAISGLGLFEGPYGQLLPLVRWGTAPATRLEVVAPAEADYLIILSA